MNLDKYRLRASVRADNLALKCGTYGMEHEIYSNLRHQIKEAILHEKMVKKVDEFSTTFVIDVIVMHPDEFHGIVQREAMELYRRMNLSGLGTQFVESTEVVSKPVLKKL